MMTAVITATLATPLIALSVSHRPIHTTLQQQQRYMYTPLHSGLRGPHQKRGTWALVLSHRVSQWGLPPAAEPPLRGAPGTRAPAGPLEAIYLRPPHLYTQLILKGCQWEAEYNISR